jgi:hypothetical protein
MEYRNCCPHQNPQPVLPYYPTNLCRVHVYWQRNKCSGVLTVRHKATCKLHCTTQSRPWLHNSNYVVYVTNSTVEWEACGPQTGSERATTRRFRSVGDLEVRRRFRVTCCSYLRCPGHANQTRGNKHLKLCVLPRQSVMTER